MSVSWRTVAYVAALIAVSLGATLVLVVATKNADLLATVALALAIITFVAQLLIYVAASAGEARHMQQSLALNRETSNILSEIKARTLSSESIMKEQFDTVLKHALRQEMNLIPGPHPAPDVEGIRGGIERSTEDVSLIVAETIRGAFKAGRDDPMLRHMWTYPPPEEADRRVRKLAYLSPLALAWFAATAELEITNRRIGIDPIGMSLARSTPWTDELEGAGLVHKYIDKDGIARAQLTDSGRDAVRVYRGIGKVPDEIQSANLNFTRRAK
jgi:hypothetical protein